MPVKNGLEVTIDLLKIDHSAKILFFSADDSIKEKALSTGAKAFLKKPANERSLLDIINKLIDLKN